MTYPFEKGAQPGGEEVFAYLPSMQDRRFARCFFNMSEVICMIFWQKLFRLGLEKRPSARYNLNRSK